MSSQIKWIILGIISIVGGVLALNNPFAASLSVELLTGYIFLIVGVMQIFAAFTAHHWRQMIWVVLIGILSVLLGISLISNPLAGLVTLTALAGMVFLGVGCFKVFIAFQARQTPFFWILVLSGLLSIVLGLMILTNFPVSAVSALGVLLGIELISNGVSMLTFGQRAK